MSLTGSIMRIPAVLEVIGCSKSTLYQHMAEGLWPKPVRISERSVGWPESEIQALLTARIAGWPNERIKALVADLVCKRAEFGRSLT